jgi:hypothetical protein
VHMLFRQIDSVKIGVDGDKWKSEDKNEIQGSFTSSRMTAIISPTVWMKWL